MTLRARPALSSLALLLGAATVALATVPAPALAEQRDDPLVRFQWHLAAIGAPDAWTVSRGAGVTVAVLDSGVAYENRGPYRRAPELAATRLVAGYDFVDDDPYPDDVPPADGRRSHGTQIATIIAATAGNGIGGSGVAPEASIMPIRVLEPDLDGTARAIARGLRFAADHGADVANLSIAGARPSRVLRAAVRYATGKGVTVVAASGNGGRPSVSWPAAYPEVVAVGAVGRDRRLTYYSNYGRALDVVAPAGAGGDGDARGRGPSDGILAQTLLGGPARFCFCWMASTSAAAAEVAGVAALVIGARRAATPSEVRTVLRATARDLGPAGPDREHGAGLVQAAAAVGAADRAAAAAPPGSPGEGSSWVPWALLAAALAAAAAAGAVLLRRRRPSGGSGSSA